MKATPPKVAYITPEKCVRQFFYEQLSCNVANAGQEFQLKNQFVKLQMGIFR